MRLFCWREAVCRENRWSKLNFWWNRVCKILFMHFRFGFKHEVLLISTICLYFALYSEHHLFEAWTISILIFCNAKFNHIRLGKNAHIRMDYLSGPLQSRNQNGKQPSNNWSCCSPDPAIRCHRKPLFLYFLKMGMLTLSTCMFEHPRTNVSVRLELNILNPPSPNYRPRSVSI